MTPGGTSGLHGHQPTVDSPVGNRLSLRFGRSEWSGSCGDIGTDVPLLVAVIMVGGLPAAWICACFGLAQILSGWLHRIPMPVQPLKALSALMIAGALSVTELQAATWVLAAAVGLLAVTPWLTWLCRHIPGPVVRGIQAALGVKLLLVAVLHMLPPSGWIGAGGAVIVLVVLGLARWLRQRHPRQSAWVWWWAPLLAALGFGWALWAPQPVVHLPIITEQRLDWWIVVAAVAAQLPLTVSNAVIATHDLAKACYGSDAPSARRIAGSYALTNGALAAVGGFPVCHGSGGLAGHHANGARTGGSVIIYGCAWLALSVVLGGQAGSVLASFPSWLLAGFLMLEAGVLIMRVVTVPTKIAALVGLVTVVFAVTIGYAWALVIGWLLAVVCQRVQGSARDELF